MGWEREHVSIPMQMLATENHFKAAGKGSLYGADAVVFVDVNQRHQRTESSVKLTTVQSFCLLLRFWATICKPTCRILSDCCLSVLSRMSVTLVANGSIDQGTTWYGGWPRPRRHCVRWDPAPSMERDTAAPPLFGPLLMHGRHLSNC